MKVKLNMSIFEQASRKKLKFVTTKGTIGVDDLWDLPLTSVNGVSLDGIAKDVYNKLKNSDVVSFVSSATSSTPKQKEDELRLELLKHVIDVKQKENQDRLSRAAKEKEAQRLMELIDSKTLQGLESKSIEELKAELSKLNLS